MVRFFHVARTYGGREVLSDLTVTLGGEIAVITGPPGAGKSVLLRLLCGLEAPSRGWITVDGLPLAANRDEVLAAHRRRLAIVPQRSLLVEDRTAAENVALALEVQGVARDDAATRACGALARLDALGLADRRAASLSTGERRVVCVARALGREDARLLIADDPVAGLDVATAQRIGRALAGCAEAGATVVVASPQPGLPGLGDARVLFLDEGRLSWDSRGESTAEAS